MNESDEIRFEDVEYSETDYGISISLKDVFNYSELDKGNILINKLRDDVADLMNGSIHGGIEDDIEVVDHQHPYPSIKIPRKRLSMDTLESITKLNGDGPNHVISVPEDECGLISSIDFENGNVFFNLR